MREVISIHIGQAGIQVGNSCWELYCLEHGLDVTGTIVETEKYDQHLTADTHNCICSEERPIGDQNVCRQSSSKSICGSIFDHNDRPSEKGAAADGFGSFFMETTNGTYSPRSIFVDLEPTVIDEVRTGKFKKLFAPNSIISGNEDAANNYARGFYTTGKLLINQVLDPVIKMAEACDKLQGFMLFHSFGGGTGSGFHSLLSQELSNEFNKLNKLEVAIFPSPALSTAVVEPYNTILSTSATLDNTQCVFLADNEAMYNICHSRLDIDNPNYRHLNRLLSLTTNLVPFPKIHFPIMSYSPISSIKAACHETLTISDITNKCFDMSNRLVKCDTEQGRYISCCLLYRGDIAPKDVNTAISHIKTKKAVHFVKWSPTGFKVGINNKAPCVFPDGDVASSQKAVCMIYNTTAIKEAWTNLNIKYNLMLEKKAFVHWYTNEGMIDRDFFDAQENILCLEEEYDSMRE